jgi:hypothetical protein
MTTTMDTDYHDDDGCRSYSVLRTFSQFPGFASSANSTAKTEQCVSTLLIAPRQRASTTRLSVFLFSTITYAFFAGSASPRLLLLSLGSFFKSRFPMTLGLFLFLLILSILSLISICIGLDSNFTKNKSCICCRYFFISQVVAGSINDIAHIWIASALRGLAYGSAFSLFPTVCLE